jgi:hypothetical protein
MENKSLEYEQLNRFVGKWKTTGIIPASGASPEIKVSGSDTYEWLPGGFFLVHKVNVLVGEDKNETLEIIGFDKQRNRYTMQHYDNKGNSGFMTADCKDGIWTFLGDKLRFRGGFEKQDTEFAGVWEQSSNGKDWTHFMGIRLTKSN